jgi:Putative Ig domain
MSIRRSLCLLVALTVGTAGVRYGNAQAIKQNPNITIDQVVRTYPANSSDVSGSDFDAFRRTLGNRIECADDKSIFGHLKQVLESKGIFPLTATFSDSHTAYLLNIAEWQPSLLGTYQITEDDWIAYRRVRHNGSCTLVTTGSKKNTTNDPLLYGINNVIFLGINHFRGSPDLNSISLGYDISTTPDTPQNVQDLGALLYALLGATLPTSTAPTGGGGAANAPDVLIALAQLTNPPRLPFFVNVTLSATMSSLGGLPDAQVGIPYSATVSATGGNGVYTFVVSSGSLPAGLVLDPQSGTISGTPSVGAPAQPFTLLAEDNSGAGNRQIIQSKITVWPSLVLDLTSPVSVSGELSDGIVGLPYHSSITATKGIAPYTYSLTDASKALFDGLSLDSSTGVISGLPKKTTLPNATVSFIITESSVPPQSRTTKPIRFNLGSRQADSTPQPEKALAVDLSASGQLSAGAVGVPYISAIVAKGGKPPYTYSLAAGSSLPSGLALNPLTGVISGVPTQVTSSPVRISFTVSDSTASSGGTPSPVTLMVQALTKINSSLPVAPVAVTAKLGVAPDGQPYTTNVKSSAATIDTRYTCAECRYYGFTITGDGTLTGNAKQSGIMSVIARTDGDERALPISVDSSTPVAPAVPPTPPPSLVITPTPLNVLSGATLGAVTGVPYLLQIGLDGYQYSCPACQSGALDTLNISASGEITGQPAAQATFWATISANNGGITFAVPVKLVVMAPGLALSLAAGGASQQNQGNAQGPPSQNGTQPGGANGPSQKGNKGQSQQGGNQNAGGPANQGNNTQNNTSSASQAVKCAFSVGSPCTFSRTVRSDDREFVDFSMGVVVPGPKERVFTSPTSSSITTHTDVYALLDLFPFFLVSPKNGLPPHFVVGLPVTSQVFHRPIFGVSENISSWTGLERLGFPQMSLFGGVVYMKQQLLTSTGTLVPDRATKAVFGVEVSVSSLVGKIGSAAKGASSKSGSGK